MKPLAVFDKHFTALRDGDHTKFFSIVTLGSPGDGFQDICFHRVGQHPAFDRI